MVDIAAETAVAKRKSTEDEIRISKRGDGEFMVPERKQDGEKVYSEVQASRKIGNLITRDPAQIKLEDSSRMANIKGVGINVEVEHVIKQKPGGNI